MPCYRSADWLESLVVRIEAVLDPMQVSYEILLVNDASPDETWSRICDLSLRHSCIRGVDLMFNTGQFRATICGLQHAVGEFIVLMDDDLQHPPEELPTLINRMSEEPALDCVMGTYSQKQHSFLRNMGTRIWTHIASHLFKISSKVNITSFVLMKRKLAEAMCLHETVSPVIGVLIHRSTSRIGYELVSHDPRVAGESGYRFFALVKIVLDNVFSSSVLPLRMITMLGLGSAVLSIFLGMYYLVVYLTGGISVPGFVTTVLLIIFFGGMTLFSSGLVGEYLLRIVDEVRRPPRYVVREIIGEKELK